MESQYSSANEFPCGRLFIAMEMQKHLFIAFSRFRGVGKRGVSALLHMIVLPGDWSEGNQEHGLGPPDFCLITHE